MDAKRALGYVRVSTDEQASHGHGLDAQRAAIRTACELRGWDLLEVVGEEKGASAKTLERAGLQDTLRRMDRGEADVLVVAKIDRLSRSLSQGSAVLERAALRGWSLVTLDFDLDNTTPVGEMVANQLLTAGRFERRMASLRTKEGLAAARAKGVRLGRPRTLSDATLRRIVKERAAGRSLGKIAAALTADGIPTARGGKTWVVSTVVGVLDSQDATKYAARAKLTLPEVVKRRRRVSTEEQR